jgi:hypothetical protein
MDLKRGFFLIEDLYSSIHTRITPLAHKVDGQTAEEAGDAKWAGVFGVSTISQYLGRDILQSVSDTQEHSKNVET